MRSIHRSLVRVGVASILGALAVFAAPAAEAATACDPASLTCSVGSASGKAQITSRLGTEIDSGWMDKGLIKIRTRFTIDPVEGDPLVALDMTKGALVEATWKDGMIELTPRTEEGAEGSMKVHYTLVPSLEANIYGFSINYNANQLLNKIPGAAFNYDAQAEAPLLPWGWDSAEVLMPAPPLDQSTIFSLPFTSLGVDPGTVEGTLSIQAATKPTFKYTTKQIRLDGSAVTSKEGVAKIPAGDADALDVVANIDGELTFSGALDVRPVIKIDTVSGFPTFGAVKFSFSAVKKTYGGEPTPVSFEGATVHIPLPNVKVPQTPLGMSDVKAGGETKKTVTIDSTGELGGVLKFTSSDPQFTVPSGEVRVGSKEKYELEIGFKPASDGPASATITVRSNDPDSPEQTFRVAANGASLDPDAPEAEGDGPRSGLEPAPSEDAGCACTSAGAPAGRLPGYGALAFAVGLLVARRRRRA